MGFVGYLPSAPGTFGTFAALLVIAVFVPSDNVLLLLFSALFIIGVWSSHNAEKALGKDSGHIVIDEFCGYIVSVTFISPSLGYYVAAFILFRIFDIFKPFPIRNIEKAVSGGAGIMLDDVLAGIYANLCLQAIIYYKVI